MKKELNYTSPEVSEEMYKLGIRWKASAYWQFIPGGNYYVLKEKLEPFKKGFPAYNMTELGHMIPFGFFNKMKIHKYLNGYFKLQTRDKKWKTYTSESEARGRYLIELFTSGNVVLEDSKEKTQPQK